MKKIAIIIFCIIIFLALVLIVFIFPTRSKNPQDISLATDKAIISILAKDKNSNDYMQAHKDFIIQDKLILNKDSILAGQNGQNFKEVYQSLFSEDSRYMRVDLMNVAGDRGLVAVIDFKTGQTVKSYGIILLEAGVK